MQYKQLTNDREKTFAVVFTTGEEFAKGMLAFAKEKALTAAHFTGIGAFQYAKLGWFNPEERQYEVNEVDEQVEVLSLVGNVADHQGEPKVHAHVVLGRRDASARGGHILEARVRPTLEITLVESPTHLHRVFDDATGLPLISPATPDLPPRRGRPPNAGVPAK